MSFKQKVCKNNSPSKPKDALSAANCFRCMQCSNTNWLMTAAKAGELFKYFQMWQCHSRLLQIIYNTFQHFLHLLRLENFMIILCMCQTSTAFNAHHLYLNNNDVTAWHHKWNHSEWCTIVAVQLHNSFGFQLSLCAYWEEQSWNLLNAPCTFRIFLYFEKWQNDTVL